MAIIAKKTGEGFDPISEGVHVAVCYSVIDLGMQYSEMYARSARKILITHEVPDETITVEGKEMPRAISKEYTLSLSEKSTLRKDLEAWRGKAFTEQELEGFDLANIIGKGCQIQVIHKESGGKVRANIASIMGLPKSMKVEDTINEHIYFDLENPESLSLLGKIPQWIQDKIKKSETYQALTSGVNALHEGGMPIDEDDDGLPF
jgi:hypothetical protein